MVHIGNEWDSLLKTYFESDNYGALRAFLKEQYAANTVYPPMNDIFNALKTTSYNGVKAVILGQDPYHNEGQAHGYCFSVKQGVDLPPSLKNIFKEIRSETGIVNTRGNLISWAEQGILLLNTVLTVRANEPNSHKGRGWEALTDTVISLLNERNESVIFVLWGNPAREKLRLITESRHFVLTAAHPSPLSATRGFFGCGHFNEVNRLLINQNKKPINWST